MISLVSTRFTNNTWQENLDYRKKINCEGCIYGSPQELSPKIMVFSDVYVVEMNNDINKIEGIGFIKNMSYADKYYKIHEDGNYNRYIYKSNDYIERDELLRYNHDIVESLEKILFKGKTHLKRGSGFTTIPEKLLNNEKYKSLDIKNTISRLFMEKKI